MGYRNLIIASPARLSVRKGQLVIVSHQENTVPIEDIFSVVVENQQCVLTAGALSALAQAGVLVISCDERHFPCGALLPISAHSRRLSQIRLQTQVSQPRAKRIWQKIVQVKIQNQAECLALCKVGGAERIRAFAQRVQSGDVSNTEAVVAAAYFRLLFGNEFVRSAESDINAALDYGYAVFRAAVARTLAVYGMEPSLGVHHCSELNRFNLADDLLEPFRPVVDLYVAKYLGTQPLDTRVKHNLVNLLNVDVLVDGKRFAASYAIEKTVQSFVTALAGKGGLQLPTLIDLSQHSYE